MLHPLSQGRVCGDGINHAGVVAGPRRLPSLRGQDNKGETLLYHGNASNPVLAQEVAPRRRLAPFSPRGLKALERMLTCLPALPAGQMLLDSAQGLKTKTNSSALGAGWSSLSPALG